MCDIPAEFEGVPVVLEFEGISEAASGDMRELFGGEDEEVAFSHAFGGADTVAIVTSLARNTFRVVSGFFDRTRTNPSKTRLKIGRGTIELNGFSRDDILALLESPRFRQMAALAKSSKGGI